MVVVDTRVSVGSRQAARHNREGVNYSIDEHSRLDKTDKIDAIISSSFDRS